VASVSTVGVRRYVGAQRAAGPRLTSPYLWDGTNTVVDNVLWAPRAGNLAAEPSRLSIAFCVLQGVRSEHALGDTNCTIRREFVCEANPLTTTPVKAEKRAGKKRKKKGKKKGKKAAP
jgi:hypothetical protein